MLCASDVPLNAQRGDEDLSLSKLYDIVDETSPAPHDLVPPAPSSTPPLGRPTDAVTPPTKAKRLPFTKEMVTSIDGASFSLDDWAATKW